MIEFIPWDGSPATSFNLGDKYKVNVEGRNSGIIFSEPAFEPNPEFAEQEIKRLLLAEIAEWMGISETQIIHDFGVAWESRRERLK